jgi:hypothetical protein
MLLFAFRIGKAQIDVFHAFIFNSLEYFLWGHRFFLSRIGIGLDMESVILPEIQKASQTKKAFA